MFAGKEIPLQKIDVGKFFNKIDGTGDKRSWTTHGDGARLYEHFFKNRFVLHWGGMADPFCYFERKNGIGYELLKGLAERNYPTLFSFKGPTVLDDKYLELFDQYKEQNNFAFQISIITADDAMGKRIEPGVPLPSERLRAMKVLSSMGYYTVLRLRPFIIGITDHSLDDLLIKAKEAGADGLSTEFFAMDGRCNAGMEKRFKEIQKLISCNDIFKYFRDLSPSERGTYRRLNRLVKERHVKKMYKFCLENDMVFACSDPDYKELSMSGCCCAMPENHPNPEMNNWSKNQLTYHLKEARKHYHRTGECKILEFDEVYGKYKTFMDDAALTHQNIGCTAYTYNIRTVITLREMLQSKWNNVNANSNPRNYLHGKIMPVGIDDAGKNLIYKYNPSEFEQRWADEGIDLTV